MSSALSGWIIVIMKCGGIPYSHIWGESDFHDTALWLSGVITLCCVFMLTNSPHDVCLLVTASAVTSRHRLSECWASLSRLWSSNYQVNLATLSKHRVSLETACLSYHNKNPASASHNWTPGPGSSWVVPGLSYAIMVPRRCGIQWECLISAR